MKTKFLLFLPITLVMMSAAPPPTAKKPEAKKAEVQPKLTPAEVKKALYVFGLRLYLGTPLRDGPLTDAELAEVVSGFTDAVHKKTPKYPLDEALGKQISQLITERRTEFTKAQEKTNSEYLAKKAAEAGAKKLETGTIIFVTKEGSGAKPTPADEVRFNYRGSLPDGTEFDSNTGKDAIRAPVGRMIPCISEVLSSLSPGGKGQAVCPPARAFGANGKGGVPPESVVLIDVELLEVIPPPPPADAGTPPSTGK